MACSSSVTQIASHILNLQLPCRPPSQEGGPTGIWSNSYLSLPAFRYGITNQESHKLPPGAHLFMRHYALAAVTLLSLSYVPLYAQTSVSATPTGVATTRTSTTDHASSPSLSPEKAAAIEEMLDLLGIKPQLIQANKQTQEDLKRYARREVAILPEVVDQDKAALSKITTKYIVQQDSFATQITWENLKPSLIQFCADNYSDDEIHSIIAFYKSPAGIALKAREAALMHAEEEAVSQLQKQIVPQSLQLTKDMKAEHDKLRPVDSTPPDTQAKPASK